MEKTLEFVRELLKAWDPVVYENNQQIVIHITKNRERQMHTQFIRDAAPLLTMHCGIDSIIEFLDTDEPGEPFVSVFCSKNTLASIELLKPYLGPAIAKKFNLPTRFRFDKFEGNLGHATISIPLDEQRNFGELTCIFSLPDNHEYSHTWAHTQAKKVAKEIFDLKQEHVYGLLASAYNRGFQSNSFNDGMLSLMRDFFGFAKPQEDVPQDKPSAFSFKIPKKIAGFKTDWPSITNHNMKAKLRTNKTDLQPGETVVFVKADSLHEAERELIGDLGLPIPNVTVTRFDGSEDVYAYDAKGDCGASLDLKWKKNDS